MSDLCGCFPPEEDFGRLAERARGGERGVPHAGDGSPDTVMSCAHGTWRLGDLLQEPPGGDGGEPPAACAGVKRSGEPCRAAPGDDGYCPAHRPKDDGGDGADG